MIMEVEVEDALVGMGVLGYGGDVLTRLGCGGRRKR